MPSASGGPRKPAAATSVGDAKGGSAAIAYQPNQPASAGDAAASRPWKYSWAFRSYSPGGHEAGLGAESAAREGAARSA
ncbi:MAG: hypothetical protein IPF66_21315 [Holophagales bacterium]|nr:hypothetical protein [Holophagales bacterium]